MTSIFLEIVAAWEVAAIAVTLLLSAYLLLDLLAEVVSRPRRQGPRTQVRLPIVSVVIPIYNESEDVLRATLASWKQVRYPTFEIVLADDSTVPVELDDPKIRVVRRTCRDGFKGGALRNACQYLDPLSEWMVVFDADFLVGPDILVRFAEHYRPGVGAVQGYQAMGRNNPPNVLTRFCEACHGVSNVLLAGRHRMGGFVAVQGTVEAYRLDAIRSIGGLAPYSTANEDLDTSFRLRKAGWKIVYDPELIGRGLAPHRHAVFFAQTTRWTSTTVREYRRHWGSFLRSPTVPVVEKVDSVFFLLTWVNSLVITPTLVFLPWVLLGLHVIPLWLSVLITILPFGLFTLPLLRGMPLRLALTGWLWYYVVLVPGYVTMFRAALLGLFTNPGFSRTPKVSREATRPDRSLPTVPVRALRRLACARCSRPLTRREVWFYAAGALDINDLICRTCLGGKEWSRFHSQRESTAIN